MNNVRLFCADVCTGCVTARKTEWVKTMRILAWYLTFIFAQTSWELYGSFTSRERHNYRLNDRDELSSPEKWENKKIRENNNQIEEWWDMSSYLARDNQLVLSLGTKLLYILGIETPLCIFGGIQTKYIIYEIIKYMFVWKIYFFCNSGSKWWNIKFLNNIIKWNKILRKKE